jgi:hypothetical protein
MFEEVNSCLQEEKRALVASRDNLDKQQLVDHLGEESSLHHGGVRQSSL